MNYRKERVNVLLRQEISRVLSEDINDPRLPPVLSVTHVDTSPDLSRARVFVSIFGGPAEKSSIMTALNAASGFVRRRLRDRVTLKSLPTVDFRLDESIEQGADVLKLIDMAQAATEGDESQKSC